MQISRTARCECGADLRQTRSDPHLITTIDDGAKRYSLFHCPACGTLFVAIDDRTIHPHAVGAGT
jgi:hypothetical protein